MSTTPLKRLRTRALACASLAAIVLGVASCGDDDSTSGTSGTSATSGTTGTSGSTGASTSGTGEKISTIQFVNPLPSYPTWRLVGDCMKKAATARDVELTESGPTGQALDPTVMVSQIQQAIASSSAPSAGCWSSTPNGRWAIACSRAMPRTCP